MYRAYRKIGRRSRDKRGTCVQVVVALVVKSEGLPLAYEMLPGTATDKTTMTAMLTSLARRYGEAERVWVTDPGGTPLMAADSIRPRLIRARSRASVRRADSAAEEKITDPPGISGH